MDTKYCEYCGKRRQRKPGAPRKWWEASKYCNRACSSRARYGIPTMLKPKAKPGSRDQCRRCGMLIVDEFANLASQSFPGYCVGCEKL